MPRSEMENHLTRDCPKAESACPLVGQCDFQVGNCYYCTRMLNTDSSSVPTKFSTFSLKKL